jgi:hypothetical protein
MWARTASRFAASVLLVSSAAAAAWAEDAAATRERATALRSILHWNQVAIDASGLDHAAAREQLGPGRSARAMAIVHIAIFDSVNSIAGGYHGYTDLPRLGRLASLPAAVAQASHDTLVALFPAQTASFDTELARELARVPRGIQKMIGIGLGRRAAELILAARQDDGSDHLEPVVNVDWPTSPDPGRWRQDPVSLIPLALGAHWGEVAPFVLESADQFRVPPPPALTSAEYAEAFDEVKRLGGDGDVTPTERTQEQGEIGIFWAYDGTPVLCAPPRLYNQVTTTISRQRRSGPVETARLLALVNVAMADAGIAIWESKYYWDFWRPVTGIREADPGTGPTGAGDGNDATLGDASFQPVGAPASNVPAGVDFTPPFPAYPSGHAGFGGALFQILRRFYGTDRIAFTFVSDEFNGETVGADGEVRPLRPRRFRNLSQAEEENGQSRIYLGIHWAFDKEQGITQGNEVADYVFDHVFTPRR